MTPGIIKKPFGIYFLKKQITAITINKFDLLLSQSHYLLAFHRCLMHSSHSRQCLPNQTPNHPRGFQYFFSNHQTTNQSIKSGTHNKNKRAHPKNWNRRERERAWIKSIDLNIHRSATHAKWWWEQQNELQQQIPLNMRNTQDIKESRQWPMKE